MDNSLEDIPEIWLRFEPSDVMDQALVFVHEHCDNMTFNHVVRSAYWASLIFQKMPSFSASGVNLEVVLRLCQKTRDLRLMAQTWQGIFCVAAKARNPELGDRWNQHNMQRCWDAIALRTTPSIAKHAAGEVVLTNMGIAVDFMGPAFPNGPGKDNLITSEEYHIVMERFPRNGFTAEGLKRVMCGLCRTKPVTTYDNFVGVFGIRFGVDGHGNRKEEFTRNWDANQSADLLLSGLYALEQLDRR
ncbi:metal dependent phosphohydrolase [Metarhizium guizhouense ARSEF 977]|uniref:Metal dependent phosphohydrolase n=1 Tax=Metarhizium guizhouense (strain ARSEF 977) TaxID=1276136 RepID=A0A0B4HQK8_METGA|nr:metal dependent phosphohydrolase [Metarhizium guizhouense ARSEF 977]